MAWILPNHIHCNDLTFLKDLSENEIKILPDSIELLTKLKSLRASQNQLDVVTPAIGSLKGGIMEQSVLFYFDMIF